MSQDSMAAFVQHINNSELPMAAIQATHEIDLPEITPQDLSGKVVMITGANVGIGYETAKSLATMKPKKIILACRNLEKAAAAAEKIKSETGYTALEISQLDLASFANVRAFAQRFLDSGEPLDILVSNAGLANSGKDWVETEDGFEVTIQVNHLANMLLCLLLTPAVAKAKGRIVVVASEVHFWAVLSPEDPHPIKTTITKTDKSNNGFQYTDSKLLNVLFAQEYARRCPYPIWICSTNPGYTDSELNSKDPMTGADNGNRRHAMIKMRSTYDGAKTIIVSAITPDTPAGGPFYSEMKPSHTRSSAQGEVGRKFAEKVWNESIEILQAKAGLGKVEDWVIAKPKPVSSKKIIAVFGAGPGFSYQVARKYAQQGYDVAFVARTQSKLDDLLTKLRKEVPNAKGVSFLADLGSEEQVVRATKGILHEFGRVDAVYSGPIPSGHQMSPAAQCSRKFYEPYFNVMFGSAVTLVQLLLPQMLERKSGAWIFGIGATAIHPMGGWSGPGPAQAALRQYVHTLNQEVAKDGVHVGIIIVGGIILGSEFAQANDAHVPAEFFRVKSEELGEIAWELYEKKEVERYVGQKL